jgi:hypothetical protein
MMARKPWAALRKTTASGYMRTAAPVRVTHEELCDARPRLYRELMATHYRDCPRIVREP